MKTAQRSSKRRTEGDEYEFDCTIDAEWYKDWYIEKLVPAIKTKMLWLRSKRVVVQQDGATPHTGKDNPEILNSRVLCIAQAKGVEGECQFGRRVGAECL